MRDEEPDRHRPVRGWLIARVAVIAGLVIGCALLVIAAAGRYASLGRLDAGLNLAVAAATVLGCWAFAAAAMLAVGGRAFRAFYDARVSDPAGTVFLVQRTALTTTGIAAPWGRSRLLLVTCRRDTVEISDVAFGSSSVELHLTGIKNETRAGRALTLVVHAGPADAGGRIELRLAPWRPRWFQAAPMRAREIQSLVRKCERLSVPQS